MERSLVLSQLGIGRGHGPLLSPPSLSDARLHFHPSSSSLKMQNQMHPMPSTVQVASRARYQAVEATTSAEASELADINWDNLGFEPVPTDYMYIAKCSQNGTFSKGELQRFGPIELSPSSGVLNYGQGKQTYVEVRKPPELKSFRAHAGAGRTKEPPELISYGAHARAGGKKPKKNSEHWRKQNIIGQSLNQKAGNQSPSSSWGFGYRLS